MRLVHGFIELFFGPKFQLHRVLGLSFLVQWVLALILYFKDYDTFYDSIFIWSLPLTGVLQSIVASLTFTFLPKLQKDPGYYGDKSTLSYNFVVENIYFASLLLFQWLYMHDTYRDYIQAVLPTEALFCFLPYLVIRPLFPKTSFRDSQGKEKNKTDTNRTFFIVVTWVTKVFYIWAKHYIGFFLNYARFLDRLNPEYIRHLYFMLIMSCAATTISMFLHTLKFKKYIDAVSAYLYYMVSYFATFYSWVRIFGIFFSSMDLTLIVAGGIVINFCSWPVQCVYQMGILVLLTLCRSHSDSIAFSTSSPSSTSDYNIHMNTTTSFYGIIPEGQLANVAKTLDDHAVAETSSYYSSVQTVLRTVLFSTSTLQTAADNITAPAPVPLTGFNYADGSYSSQGSNGVLWPLSSYLLAPLLFWVVLRTLGRPVIERLTKRKVKTRSL